MHGLAKLFNAPGKKSLFGRIVFNSKLSDSKNNYVTKVTF